MKKTNFSARKSNSKSFHKDSRLGTSSPVPSFDGVAYSRYLFPVCREIVGNSAYRVRETSEFFIVENLEGKPFYSISKETYKKYFHLWTSIQYMLTKHVVEYDRARGWGYYHTDLASYSAKRRSQGEWDSLQTGNNAQAWCLYHLDKLLFDDRTIVRINEKENTMWCQFNGIFCMEDSI